MRLRAGFSLIELLVVVSIVVLLAGMLLPTIGMVRSRARTTMCANKLHNIGLAATTYASDFDGLYPPSFSNPNTWQWIHIGVDLTRPHGLGFLTDDYLEQRNLLACPEINLNNSYGNYASIDAFTRLYAGYRYIGNQYSDVGITYFTQSVTSSARGPNLLPSFFQGMTNPGVTRMPLAHDLIADSTNPKQVYHPHPRDDSMRTAGTTAQVEGGNVLYVDLHVGFLPGANWRASGPYGGYIPWYNL